VAVATGDADKVFLPIKALDRETVVTEISRRLLEYLLSGDVHPGARLPSERKLAQDLGVGRSAVREAIKSLSLLGLLDVRQGDGTYVKSAESQLLPQVIEWGLLLGQRRSLDLVEARQHLEVAVAVLAAKRRTSQQVLELRKCLENLRTATDVDSFVAADIALHTKVAEIAGNSVFVDILTSIRSLLNVWMRRVLQAAAGDLHPSYSEHIGIVDAIEKGDPDAAAEAMKQHMSSASKRLFDTMA
jgi:GntR family transcriptional repressor for pyruvate dehydrogenase complex